MTKIKLLITVILSLLFQTVEARVALLIGNDNYSNSKLGVLRLAVSDTKRLEVKLKQLGFKVMRRNNLNKEQMKEALRDYKKALLMNNEVGLFYFSGHGMQIDGHNFLIPINSGIKDKDEAKTEAIDADLVLDKMLSTKSRINLVFLDACRTNGFSGRGRQGLVSMPTRPNTFIAYATQAGDTAADGTLMDALSQRITEPLPVDEMFKKVITDVYAKTNGNQQPSYTFNLLPGFSLNNNYFGNPSAPIFTKNETMPPRLAEKEVEVVQTRKRTPLTAHTNDYIDKKHIKKGVSVKFNHCDFSKKVTGVVCYVTITALKAEATNLRRDTL